MNKYNTELAQITKVLNNLDINETCLCTSLSTNVQAHELLPDLTAY